VVPGDVSRYATGEAVLSAATPARDSDSRRCRDRRLADSLWCVPGVQPKHTIRKSRPDPFIVRYGLGEQRLS
jgi:hypothetical protein